VPPHSIEIPVANPVALGRAAAMILDAERPLIMLGAAASRPRLADALSDFVRHVRIPFFNTQMGKGAVAGGSSLYMGTAALSERDYVHKAIDSADLILSIGHDTVEKPPFLMGPAGPKVIHIGYVPATVDEVFAPQTEVVGDVGPSLALLADRLKCKLKNASALLPLRDEILAHLADRATESRFPLTAVRLGLNLVVLIVQDDAYGMIRWKQAVDRFADWGLTFGNPDFVKYAESYGAKGSRVETADGLVPALEAAFEVGGVHLVAVPVDYSENNRVLVDELRPACAAAAID
jgi:thiamine pyrophosphate-dependent acetolactate synthase large subunit-like protein